MCVIPPKTGRSLGTIDEVVGVACPVCADGTRIGLMSFLDPHGVLRVDEALFECEARRHTYVRSGPGYRLVTADGRRVVPVREFALGDDGLLGEAVRE